MFVDCVPLLVICLFAAAIHAYYAHMINDNLICPLRPVAMAGSALYIFFFFWILYRCIYG